MPADSRSNLVPAKRSVGAATFVLNSDGKIVYKFIDADYKKRAEPADLIAELRKFDINMH